jgi:hypothetical protein
MAEPEKARQDDDKDVSTELKHDEKDGVFMNTDQDDSTANLSKQDVEKIVLPTVASPSLEAAFTDMSLVEQTGNLASRETDVFQPDEPIVDEPTHRSMSLEDQPEELDASDNALQLNEMIGSESSIGNVSLEELEKQQDIECDSLLAENVSDGEDEELQDDKLAKLEQEPRIEEQDHAIEAHLQMPLSNQPHLDEKENAVQPLESSHREAQEQPTLPEDNTDPLDMQTAPVKEVLLEKEKPKERSHQPKERSHQPKERSHPMKLRQSSIQKRDKHVKHNKKVLKRAALKTYQKEKLDHKALVEQDERYEKSKPLKLLPQTDKMPRKKDVPKKRSHSMKLRKRAIQTEESKRIQRSASEPELSEKTSKKKMAIQTEESKRILRSASKLAASEPSASEPSASELSASEPELSEKTSKKKARLEKKPLRKKTPKRTSAKKSIEKVVNGKKVSRKSQNKAQMKEK